MSAELRHSGVLKLTLPAKDLQQPASQLSCYHCEVPGWRMLCGDRTLPEKQTLQLARQHPAGCESGYI